MLQLLTQQDRSYLYGGVRLYLLFFRLGFVNVLCRRTTNSKVYQIELSPPNESLKDFPTVTFKNYNIGVKFVNGDNPADFAKAIDDKTKAIFVESIGNPKYNVAPIPELAKVGCLQI